uniref:Capsid protein n=1 Tax=Genomoviridae sp. TaxID=2202565 RepID=A0A8F5MLC7_9VIRU|nr:MAG: capsid protein [Genomoviridae sp.]
MAYSIRGRRSLYRGRKRRSSRRAVGKRRTYRSKRRIPRRRRWTTRAILNKTSQKKYDNMLSYSDVETPGTFVQGGARLNAAIAGFYTFTWIATARPAENFTGTKGSKVDVKVRTNQTIFARGLKEKIRLQTLGGVGWSWRRICYTLKGDRILGGDVDPTTSEYFRLTSNGMARLVHQESSSRSIQAIFQGQQGQDWENAMNAKVDTRNITVMYDRIRTIQSGNESGVSRHYNLWHPMNKNVVYEDEEAGDSMFTSAVSTESRAGMGDYYVTDFFEPNRGGVAGDDDLEFQPHATFYWHEK